MKKSISRKNLVKAALVFAVALAFVIPTSAVITNPLSIKTYPSTSYSTKQIAIHEPLPVVATFGTDVLVSSDNPDYTDETPKATMNSDGTIVVTYEKDINVLTRHVPVVYSTDDGQTWTNQFEFDTLGLSGSEYLQSPDIKYCPETAEFFWHGIDPFADQYNEEYYWIPGDIANATEASGYGSSGVGSIDYTEGALTPVGKWLVGLSIHTSSPYNHTLGLGYMWNDGATVLNPEDVDPTWAAGYYYDAGSVLKTTEASQPEMATGNHLYMVCQSFNGVYSNISFKATVTDLNPGSPTFLFTKGGGPGGMDKYADIEAWPVKQFFVAVNATDPDVGAKGNVVAVVYGQAGNVKCRTSIDGGGNWTNSSTVATAAGYPAVYVTANKIYCAYVKGGNLFYAVSSDNGATWGTATQVNDQTGTVVAQPGTVDIGAGGFVWTDNRNAGKNDIYYEYFLMEPVVKVPKLEIVKLTGAIGVSATIKNNGNALATNMTWTIKVTGGILKRINVTATDKIASLAIGGEGGGKTKMILGFGSISVVVTATCDEGSTATLTKEGKQLLFFTSIK